MYQVFRCTCIAITNSGMGCHVSTCFTFLFIVSAFSFLSSRCTVMGSRTFDNDPAWDPRVKLVLTDNGCRWDCTMRHVTWTANLRGAWSDRDTNDIFAHCSLIFCYLDFKFSNFVCPSELRPLIWFFLKKFFRKKKNIRKPPKTP